MKFLNLLPAFTLAANALMYGFIGRYETAVILFGIGMVLARLEFPPPSKS